MKMIDDINIKILKILQNKARIPNVEISRTIGLAPSAVLERIRKLEDQGYIDGYEVRLNSDRFDCRQVAFIHVQISTANELSISAALSAIPEIQEIHFLTGEDCFLVKVRVSGMIELGRILREKISPITGVYSTRTLPVLATYKENARIPIREPDPIAK
jgi:Lrp/AsnC family transcriptional regulator, leucine-responsive regulatory protein